MSGWRWKMTVDISNQHLLAVTDKIIYRIHHAVYYVRAAVKVSGGTVSVELEVNGQLNDSITTWLKETIALVYNKYGSDPDRIIKLYAAVANRFTDNKISISEVDSDGCGTTVHFTS